LGWREKREGPPESMKATARHRCCISMALLLALGFSPTDGKAEPSASEACIPVKLHPWGTFDPGAWKTVRVVTETLNEQGQVCGTNRANTKTTLVDIDNEGITLEVQACMEVAGKRFEGEPQTVKQGFHGELAGPELKLMPPTDGEVAVEGQKIACKVQRLEAAAANATTVTTLYYTTTIAPYVLRRVSAAGDPEKKETIAEVISLNMPLWVRGEMKNGIRMKTVHRTSTSTVTTWADVLPDVPGGVVSSSSKETDCKGRLVRRSTLELVDYGLDPEKDRTGVFGRKRSSRHHKPPPRYGP
jgi:hypothetical protein